jgi:hypothetical protein
MRDTAPSSAQAAHEQAACKVLGLRWPQAPDGALRALDLSRNREGDRVQIRLEGPGWATRLEISQRNDSEPAFARTERLDLRYQGSDRPPAVVAQLAAHLQKRLAKVTFDTLGAMADRLPKLLPVGAHDGSGDASHAPDPIDPPDLHRGLQESWGHPDRWRIFLMTSEIKRARDSAVQVDLPWVQIEHGDFECQFVGVGDFLNLPWRSPWLRGQHNANTARGRMRAGRAGERPADEGREGGPRGYDLVTDLHDMDVITGGTNRLADLLETLREEQEIPPELIQLNCTCVPLMNGDDVEFLVTEERKKAKFPIILTAQYDVHPYGAHIEAMQKRLLAAPRVEPDPQLVNLVGFPEGDGLDDLLDHLAAMGVRVHCRTVPKMSPPMMDAYRQAGVQIMLENADWQPMVDFCFGTLEGMTTHRLAPPFGVAPAIRWLESVAAALPLSAEDAERAAAHVGAVSAAMQDQLAPLRARAARHGFGFIIEPPDVTRFTEPARFFSLPVLATLEELGFPVRFAVFDDGEHLRADLEAALGGMVTDPAHLHFTWFTEQAELDAWLASDELDLVFSDYLYDHRITSAGKSPVSSHAFEMGPEGALRSAARLLRLCESSFYGRLGRYLARPRPTSKVRLEAFQ